MGEEKITVVNKDGAKLIPIKMVDRVSEEDLVNDLNNLIELINDRKERASIDVTRINLEKARKLCEDIMSKRRRDKSIF